MFPKAGRYFPELQETVGEEELKGSEVLEGHRTWFQNP